MLFTHRTVAQGTGNAKRGEFPTNRRKGARSALMTDMTKRLVRLVKKGEGYVRAGQERRRGLRAERQDSSGLGYIVILTYGRTGSTVLQGALNTVDGVSIRGENYGVCNHIAKLHAAAERTNAEQSGGITTDTISPWYGAHLIDPDGLLRTLRDGLVNDVLKSPAGTTITGFKEIRHTTDYFATFEELVDYTVFLERLLPGVKFVVNTRGAEDTSKSGWWKDDPGAVELLNRTREWMLRLPDAIKDRLGAGRVVVMEYEIWNKNPQELARMLRELGLPADLGRLTEVSHRRLDHMQSK